MSMQLDKEFVNLISGQLDGFSWERDYIANFRCPICGDSEKHKKKRRGYFYPDSKENILRFKCHNCSEMSGWSLGAWLSKFNSTVFKEYQLERFKESGGSNRSKRESYSDLVAPKTTTTNRILGVRKEVTTNSLPIELLENYTRLSDLPPEHYARQYMEGRKLPSWAMGLLGFTENYRDMIRGIGISDEELLKNAPRDHRIVIPLLSKTFQLMGVQGRAMDKSASLRYATNKLKDDYPKTFGLQRIDQTKPILVVEGPIDSCFLPNCVATADSNLMNFHGTVYIPDNQYRNFQICQIMEKLIDNGKTVCIFPQELSQHKDINDMVVYGGLTSRKLIEVIATNSFSGPKAKMVWATRRKV